MDYDVIIIGGGHNGLVAAGYLARAGERVLVLEARDHPGGACTTEELIPGSPSKWSSCAFIAGLLRPEVISELELKRFGLELYQGDALGFALFRDGEHLMFWKELDRTLAEIRRHSAPDARRFVEFGMRMQRFASILRPWLLKPPPLRSELLAEFEQAGEEALFDEFVLLSIRDLLDRYFESENLKGYLSFMSMVSTWGGPSAPGSSYVFGHHSWGDFEGEFGQFGFAKGGMGAISEALARSAEHYGATIRCNAPVAEILTGRGRVQGVRLDNGEVINATRILSSADPKRTFLKLMDPASLPTDFRAAVEAIDVRGSMARIHLLIDELPQYLPFDSPAEGPQHHGHQMLGASRETFEEGWEAQRRGRFPDHFVIEATIQSVTDPSLAPPGQHTMTLGIQQVPFELDGTTWDEARETWADKVLEELFTYAPNLREHILDRVVITPLDLERTYHLTGGNIFQGAMPLDQLFSSRPLPALANYRGPFDGLYLCGAGTHPGGGVMGANGHNGAQVALADAGKRPDPTRRDQAPHGVPRRTGRTLDRLIATPLGRRTSYELARQPALRKVVHWAAKRQSR
jgi:phytoene dehydrogenase-like protein